jgi:hypothetical protein
VPETDEVVIPILSPALIEVGVHVLVTTLEDDMLALRQALVEPLIEICTVKDGVDVPPV